MAKAKTKGDDLLMEISRWVASAHRFLDEGDRSIHVLKWQRSVEDVMRVNAQHGSILKAKLAEYQGDIEQADRWYTNAYRLGLPWHEMAENMLVTCCNLGYGSKGLRIFREHVDISHGNIGRTIWLAIGVGAFHYMNHLITQAARGKVELPTENMDIGRMVSDVVIASGASDDDCSAVIDVAGEVLRRHRLFWLGDRAKFVVDKESRSVLMRFSVDATYRDASSMTMEAAQLLVERNLDASPFMIDFVGVRA